MITSILNGRDYGSGAAPVILRDNIYGPTLPTFDAYARLASNSVMQAIGLIDIRVMAGACGDDHLNQVSVTNLFS